MAQARGFLEAPRPWWARGKLLGIASVLVGLSISSHALADGDHAHPPAQPEQAASSADYVEGAKRLEGRLLAPCCWDTSKQTLDIHDSPVAQQLKQEIRRRLSAGEAPDAIEASLVLRYGEKIRAVPEGNPLKRVGLMLSLLVAIAGVGLGYQLFKWKKRREESLPVASPAARDKWDEELDAELARED